MALAVITLGEVLSVLLLLGLLVSSSVGSLWVLLFSQLLFKSFLSTLSSAHLGYLHLVRTFLRWFISSLISSGLVQSVLALWVGVLITLYLAARLR